MPPRILHTVLGFVLFCALGREFCKPLNDNSLSTASFIRYGDRPFDEVDKADADKDIARQVVQDLFRSRDDVVEPTSYKPVKQIIVLGERHSGTKWITDHLAECFDINVTNTYKRNTHWFQEEDLTRVPENSAVVVVMFRDPYHWVEAMRVEPHHAHDHLQWHRHRPHTDRKQKWKELARPLEWKEFVTRP